VPGHSPGSLVFYSGESKLAITGDVLFQGSIGRTDLPGGDYNLLIEGIRSKLLHLPKETVIYPGHGPVSTIGTEHDTNPFL
jgi:glyoxylase-like metal-dependent hydrolase (beta-lactamase superfamily II)